VGGEMRHGYARISAEEQNLARQRRALAAAGCDHVVEEIESGVKARRRLDGLLSQLQAGDELIVYELIRREIKLTVLSLPSLDIGTNDGRLIADILASLAAHERRRLRERQRQGINAARLAGRHLGRRPKMNLLQVREARQRIAADESVSVVARAYGVTPKTLRATLDRTSQAGG
jgi:putative DNA-invertase from lambdoid prophage Rac